MSEAVTTASEGRHASRVAALLREPFRIRNTELPDNVLLLVKVLTLAFIATGQFRLLSWHFLPFLGFFDRLGSPALFHWTLIAIFLAAATALFYNWRVRLCCLVLGSTILISLLSSRIYFENNRTFCACILLLAGLCSRNQKPWPLRAQVVLVYFGAALNKILQTDWRSGQFFWYWFGQIHHRQIWAHVTAFVPAMPLARFICWVTIVTELVLVIGFFVPRWYAWAIWLGAAYHTALLLVMNSTFGMFYYAMLASYLAFVDWPVGSLKVVYDDDRRFGFLERLDIAGSFQWIPFRSSGQKEDPSRRPADALLLVEPDRARAGFAAFKRILLLSPPVYAALVILLGRQPHAFQYHRWLAAAVVAFFTPFLSPLWEPLYRWITHDRGGRVREEAAPEMMRSPMG